MFFVTISIQFIPEFLEFAIENFSEMMGYIAKGNLDIKIHWGITGEKRLE